MRLILLFLTLISSFAIGYLYVGHENDASISLISATSFQKSLFFNSTTTQFLSGLTVIDTNVLFSRRMTSGPTTSSTIEKCTVSSSACLTPNLLKTKSQIISGFDGSVGFVGTRNLFAGLCNTSPLGCQITQYTLSGVELTNVFNTTSIGIAFAYDETNYEMYVAEASASKIRKLKITSAYSVSLASVVVDRSTLNVSSGSIRNVIVNPATSSLYWIERNSTSGIYSIMTSNLNGQSISLFWSSPNGNTINALAADFQANAFAIGGSSNSSSYVRISTFSQPETATATISFPLSGSASGVSFLAFQKTPAPTPAPTQSKSVDTNTTNNGNGNFAFGIVFLNSILFVLISMLVC